MQIVDPFSGDDYELVTKAGPSGFRVGALMGANRAWERGGDAIAAGRTAATTGGRKLVATARNNPSAVAGVGAGIGAVGLGAAAARRRGVEKAVRPMPGGGVISRVSSVSPSTATMNRYGGHENKLLVKTGGKTGGKRDHLAHYRGKGRGGKQPGLERYGKRDAYEGQPLVAKRGTPMGELQRSGRHGVRLATV